MPIKTNNKTRTIKNKSLVLLLIFSICFGFPSHSFANVSNNFLIPAPEVIGIPEISINILNPFVLLRDRSNPNRLPENKSLEVDYSKQVVLTAYNSEAAQCDSTSCITANGFDLCKHDEEDTIATNNLRLGTRVKIPELFGDKVFVVRDRMNARYGTRMDVWMKNRKDAKEFGVKVAKIEVLK